MSQKMKKIGSIGLLAAMMLLCFLPSCGKKAPVEEPAPATADGDYPLPPIVDD